MKHFVKFRREHFGRVLKENGLQGKGIEVGVASGVYSRIIAENFGLTKLYLLDNWKGYEYISQRKQDGHYKGVTAFAEEHKELIEVIKCDSIEGCKLFDEQYFDFIYIDADHHYESVIKDLRGWYSKLKDGGMIAGHDYKDFNNDNFGVQKAVDEFCEELEMNFFITKGTNRIPPSWYFIKRKDM